MNTNVIQERIDAMVRTMLDRGLPEPHVAYRMESLVATSVFVAWKDDSPGARDYATKTSFFRGDNALGKAEEMVSALPDKAERDKRDFLDHLAATIERGRQHGIDVEFVNPLVEAMKRLSENAIEFKG